MINTDVLIVGGGPAGSSCARRLKQLGIDSVIIDRQPFPRFKPCAGWITPGVVKTLDDHFGEYPHGLTAFTSFEVMLGKLHIKLRTRQYAIRRVEFDHWLLQRAGVPFYVHTAKEIIEKRDRFVVDGEFSGKFLIGAGGTHCPVYRCLFEPFQPRDKKTLIVAQEEEFQYPYTDPRCWLWFFQQGLPGYAWFVPKADGYVNVGVGGNAEQIRSRGDSLKRHWNLLTEKLETHGLVTGHAYKPVGHSYYIRQPLLKHRQGNAIMIGDSSGLATADMGEGIGPAIASGFLAAVAIVTGKDYTVKKIPRLSIWSLIGLQQ